MNSLSGRMVREDEAPAEPHQGSSGDSPSRCSLDISTKKKGANSNKSDG